MKLLYINCPPKCLKYIHYKNLKPEFIIQEIHFLSVFLLVHCLIIMISSPEIILDFLKFNGGQIKLFNKNGKLPTYNNKHFKIQVPLSYNLGIHVHRHIHAVSECKILKAFAFFIVALSLIVGSNNLGVRNFKFQSYVGCVKIAIAFQYFSLQNFLVFLGGGLEIEASAHNDHKGHAKKYVPMETPLLGRDCLNVK